jgi:serine/threonine protein kinase
MSAASPIDALPAGDPPADAALTRLRAGGEPPSEGDTASEGDTVGAGSSIGTLLGGRYRVERKLGEGGLGAVYLVRDVEFDGELFAIKLLRPEIRVHPDALEMLREEVRKTRALQHPNIVGVYSLNGAGRESFILMEYLEGKTLKDLIEQDFGRGMPFDRAWPLIRDIGAALAYAHDHSVIHCDLKPSNVFVTTSGKAKLLDFGIARAARGRPGRFDPAALGAMTPAYASCELIEAREPDQRDDVYSLGCLLYEMLSGRLAFDTATALEARLAGAKVAPIRALTRRQNRALERALDFDRERRTDSVEMVLEELRPRASFGAPTARWTLASALAVAALASLVWFHMRGSQSVPGSVPGPESPGRASASPLPAAATGLDQLAALAERARSLGVDPEDPSMRRGLEALLALQTRTAPETEPESMRLLAEGKSSLDRAVRSARRIAHLGSDPQEIARAVAACRAAGGRCREADFGDELARSALLVPFDLDPTEVTNGAFEAFATAKRYVTAAERTGKVFAVDYRDNSLIARPGESWRSYRNALTRAGRDASIYPVRGIDFRSAEDFCRWRQRRLPTEEEWEFVARGPDHRAFAWGDAPRVADSDGPTGPQPVAEQPASGYFSAHGLGDGLLEWVEGGSADHRVLRGASWLDTDPLNQRLARRREIDPNWSLQDTGFRCARSLAAWPDAESS